jgi:hypothetical protein
VDPSFIVEDFTVEYCKVHRSFESLKFGKVKGGELRVKGHVAEAMWHKDQNVMIYGHEKDGLRCQYSVDIDLEQEDLHLKPVWLLLCGPIGRYSRASSYWGLALRRLPDGYYSRFGRLRVHFHHRCEPDWLFKAEVRSITIV